MRSVQYIDQAITKHGLKNDLALAKKLGWASSKISQYRTGKRFMDNEACIALAMCLEIDPLQIIMAADLDRAERAGQHSLWEVFMSRMAGTAASTILGMLVLLSVVAPKKVVAAEEGFKTVPFRQ